MVKKIKWTKSASKSFNKTINYLEQEWSEKVAEKFVQKVYAFLLNLEEYPEIGKIEIEEKGIRGFVLSRHTTVLYRIKGNYIILLQFFDNRQDPIKKGK
jgi:plasmid stabilization system protein ParE